MERCIMASANELELLENVELRFALAETDAQLERTLTTFLCPVLLKLASDQEVVRNKVIGILTHINKRIRSKPEIKLPLPGLLQQFTDSPSVLVRNFSLMYIEMGFPRITQEEKSGHLPRLVKGISKRPAAQQVTLLHIILPILANIRNTEDDATADPFDFTINPADALVTLSRFLDVILYRPPTTALSSPSTSATTSVSIDSSPASMTHPVVPNGMSPQAVKFVSNDGKAVWANSSGLKDIKLGVLRFVLSTSTFPDDLAPKIHTARFILLLAATGDVYNEVSSLGDDGLKRIKQPDLEQKGVVDQLFELYQGSNNGTRIPGHEDMFRTPCSNSVKLKIMGYLMKSKRATMTFPSALQVSFDCLYGQSTTSKLIMAGMAFVQWMARMSDQAALEPIAHVLVSGLLKYTRVNEDAVGIESESSKGFAYVATSLIAKRVPKVVRQDLSIVSGFFEQIGTQPSSVRTYIQEALCTMLEALDQPRDWATADDMDALVKIVESNIDKEQHQARFCAIKYATTLFPFSDLSSKYVCLMSIVDEKLEIREEAKKGLTFPTNSKELQPQQLPDFANLIQLLLEKSRQLRKRDETFTNRPTFGKSFILGYPAEVFIHILQFLRQLLVMSADLNVITEELSSNEFELQQFVFTPSTRQKVKLWLRSLWDKEESALDDGEVKSLASYISLLETGLDYQGTLDKSLQTTALTCLLELVSLAPSGLSIQYSDRLGWFKSESRQAVAHIIGIVSTDGLLEQGPRREAFAKFISELLDAIYDSSKQTSAELKHGSILAIGYILGRILYRYPENGQIQSIIAQSDLDKCILAIADNLDVAQNMFISGASMALGEMGRYGPLPLSTPEHREDVLKRLIRVASTAKDTKVQETAITALGHVGVGNPELAQHILQLFYDLAAKNLKQAEVNFTIGEAMACIGGGWTCTAMDVHVDLADVEPSSSKRVHENGDMPSGSLLMDNILNKILDEMAPSLKAGMKKAACIWLLSMVKFCSSHPSVKNQLPRLHRVFSSMLSDRDEMTQEVASKGIGLVYDLGDQKMRTQLVESLVGMFGENRRANQKVTGETEIFESNALGQAPDGSSLSTYQSILSLASDMNQPELVYKFMHLASHNAMWQSRKGAAFGFSSILAQAEQELKPYMATLIPKLYRYQYDPNPKVNEAMTSIWRSLVKEPKKAVQEYFDVIIQDLLTGMGARAWRSRESSCLAMADLLQGRTVEEIAKYLEQIWNMSFRALDDIKESVRVAAFKTCRAMTLMTVKYCDPKHVKVAEGERVLSIVIPFLLHKGLVSSAEDVCKFSLTTLLKICKQAGPLLKKHIPEIVVALLEGLTSMEPQMMNYLSFHTDKYQVSQEQLESSRLNAAKLSPMMEGIEACIETMDESVLAELAPMLHTAMRKAVGLPTKAGSAHLLVSLCIKKPAIMRPHADSLLKLLGALVKDKSPAVRKSYSVSAGYMARLVSDEALVRFLSLMSTRYVESEEEEDIRSVSAIVVREISKNATDRFKSVASCILPTVFYGTVDAHKQIAEIWKEVWEEHTAGSSATIKLYANEILDLLAKQLTSPSWNAKKQSALAIKVVAETMDLAVYLNKLMPLILDSLSGRTWQGKEAVVQLLSIVPNSSKAFFEAPDNQKQLHEIAKVLLRESKKVNKQYRRFAIDALGAFLDGFSGYVGYYQEAKPILFKILHPNTDDDSDMDVDDEHAKPLQLMVLASAAKCLGLAWSVDAAVQRVESVELATQVLAEGVARNVWNVRNAFLESIDKFLTKLQLDSSQEQVAKEILPPQVVSALVDGLIEGALRDFKYLGLRTLGLQVIKTLVARLADHRHLVLPEVKAKVEEALAILSKDPVPKIAEEAALMQGKL
ncbi:hypothetical protein DFQ27_008011 [Actinomortierella ambigua]|uniref:ARM repeat-containing protein n=1 Tax=Actinomortierella ambigua TaxID=1343610 RepID=A0A9P6PUX0_9FUNG|nr:hypothetical protein DFQ27_008011 [Actinomortierella ambigua]